MKTQTRRGNAPKIRLLIDQEKPVGVVLKVSDYRSLLERIKSLEELLNLGWGRRKSVARAALAALKRDLSRIPVKARSL
jgi:hypothetical protein